MLVNLLTTAFYLFMAFFLGFCAWSGMLLRAPAWFLWLGAGAFLLTGAWRLLHLSRG